MLRHKNDLRRLKSFSPQYHLGKESPAGFESIYSNNVFQDNGLIDRLYGMLRDQDPTVVTFSLQTLTFLLKEVSLLILNISIQLD